MLIFLHITQKSIKKNRQLFTSYILYINVSNKQKIKKDFNKLKIQMEREKGIKRGYKASFFYSNTQTSIKKEQVCCSFLSIHFLYRSANVLLIENRRPISYLLI